MKMALKGYLHLFRAANDREASVFDSAVMNGNQIVIWGSKHPPKLTFFVFTAAMESFSIHDNLEGREYSLDGAICLKTRGEC